LRTYVADLLSGRQDLWTIKCGFNWEGENVGTTKKGGGVPDGKRGFGGGAGYRRDWCGSGGWVKEKFREGFNGR